MESGTKLGHYEILSALGKGGMGEVWRARDTKLGREVAIKTLPEEFAKDADRLARFEREAKLLASLNHPNIAAIYGLEEHEGIRFLVLELVEGPTLGDRIKQGAIPNEESLELALQIAEALEAAHEKGVIHRDLKPANIKVTPDGKVKVLDFGLAKALADDEANLNLSNSPTLSMAATQQGVILGTAAYMSPEQARGVEVDKRADIWAFGCVVYEMLTGRQVFRGELMSDVMASVLKSSPDYKGLPPTIHPKIKDVLRRCLEKDPKNRYRDIGDVSYELRQVEGDPSGVLVQPVSEVEYTRQRSSIHWAAAFLVGVAVASISVWTLMRSNPEERVWLTAVHSGGALGNVFDSDIVLTPDGSSVVYAVTPENLSSGNIGQLFVRPLDQLEPILLSDRARSLFVSHDGQWVGFSDGVGQWMKVAITGGPSVPIVTHDAAPRGASWGPDNSIVFATTNTETGLFRISAEGGEAEPLTTPDPENGELDHLFPEFLANGNAVLFTITNDQSIDNSQVAVLDLESGDYGVLIQAGSNPRYAASGHIVYGVAGTLRAVDFDPNTLEVRGTPVPVLDDVFTKATGAASFSLSSDGKLAYLSGGAIARPQRELVWVDREGREEAINTPPREFRYPRLSPDGTQIVVDIVDEGGDEDIWILNLVGETSSRLTLDPGRDTHPVWTPDGQRIMFSSAREGLRSLYRMRADGTEEAARLTDGPGRDTRMMAISPDATRAVYRDGNSYNIMSVLLNDGQIEPLVQTPFNDITADISPDGRWLAYDSDESGQREVYVRPFPNVSDGRWPLSVGGGTRPVWSRDGTELFYLRTDGLEAVLMSVRVREGTTWIADRPTMLFEGSYFYNDILNVDGTMRTYDVSPDGQQFLMVKDPTISTDGEMPRQINIVLNWFEELKERVPTP